MREFGLLGFPLGHSFSKRYFTEKFAKEKINACYTNFETENAEDIIEIIKNHTSLHGFNVTIPHKSAIIPLLSEISEDANEMGAVNCVKIIRYGGVVKLCGYNTDAAGFREALLNFIPEIPDRALVFGNGGAAKAVRYVLKNLGSEPVTVSRTPRNPETIDYRKAAELVPHTPLLINTTPLGMWPDCGSYPDIPYNAISSGHYLFDLVYNPETTEFMKRGAEAGAHVCNGYRMLTAQAEAGWQIWNVSKK